MRELRLGEVAPKWKPRQCDPKAGREPPTTPRLPGQPGGGVGGDGGGKVGNTADAEEAPELVSVLGSL